VRAELSISHRQGNMLGLLESLYGANDDKALEASEFARKAPISVRSIDYAARTPSLIVMAWFAPKGLEIYVESTGGRLREGAVNVWWAIRQNGKKLKPDLERLAVFDEDSNDVLVSASGGIEGRLRQDGLFVPIATGIVTVVVLMVVQTFGHASADFFYGSATALGVAIMSVGRLLWRSKTKELVWR
jgi:hypothetical protein